MRVLLVEDDSSTARSIEMILKSEGYMVESTDLGEDAYELGKFYEYDIIILDLMLPDMHGYDVLKKLRAEKINIPILILSGLAELDSKIKGLGFGADDYLTKPFEMMELLARVEALLRRAATAPAVMLASTEAYQFDSIKIDFRRAEVERDGEKIELSAKEFQLLRYFIEHREATLSRDELLNEVWGYDAMPTTRTVDVHVAWLRQKLEPDPAQPRHLLTETAVGYRLVTDA